jgi:hypothetical protein
VMSQMTPVVVPTMLITKSKSDACSQAYSG